MSAVCRFAPLPEHKPSECPLCNPTDWMARDEDDLDALMAGACRAERWPFDQVVQSRSTATFGIYA